MADFVVGRLRCYTIIWDVTRFAAISAPIVAAWCDRQGQLSPGWVSGGARALATALYTAGVLDFRRLTPADLLMWLPRVDDGWPPMMSRTLDLNELGIDQVSVAAWARRLKGTQTDPLPRRTVDLDKESVSLESASVQRLIELTDVGLGGRLDAFPPEVTQLGPLPQVGKGGGHRNGSGTGDQGLSDEEMLVVGFIGELVAYRWLCHHFGERMVTWCSSLASNFNSDWHGNDHLGYDLRALDRGKLKDASKRVARQLLIEVKAIGTIEVGRTLSFTLTRREVEVAQEHADDDTYFILLVADVLHSKSRSIHLLPNPYSTRGRRMFRDRADTRTVLFNLPK